MQVLWLRSDLRLADNPALAASMDAARATSTPLLALYVAVAEDRERFPIADIKLDFIARTLERLTRDLAALGVPLLVLRAATDAHLREALPELMAALGAQALRFNNEYPWYERERDRCITRALRTSAIAVERFDDRVVLPPASLRTGAGQPYRVFTPYKRAWLKRVHSVDIAPLAIPSALSHSLAAPAARRRLQDAISSANLPLQLCLGAQELAVAGVAGADLWPAGAPEAQRRLTVFIEGPITHYGAARDFPALAGTSCLSPYLAIGAISTREILWQLHQTFGPLAEGGEWGEGVNVWLSELIWREFYQHLVVDFPALGRGQPMQRDTIFVPWRGANEAFTAWCEGRTGFPIIDAAMVQLRTTGWMHNRLRMLTASFLCKNLLVDWRLGERFFMQHLIDGDFAANNGGWQWSASTGADAAPYFRVFNPVTQSRKFDPDGAFLIKFLPQLAALPAKLRHDPQGVGYYPPLVDLGQSRAASIAAFAACRHSLSQDNRD